MKKKLLLLSLPLAFIMLASCSGGGEESSSSSEPTSSPTTSESSSTAPSSLTPEEIIDEITNPDNATLLSSMIVDTEVTYGTDTKVYHQKMERKNTTKITPTSLEGSQDEGETSVEYPISYIAAQLHVEDPTDEQIEAFVEAMKPMITQASDDVVTTEIDRTNSMITIKVVPGTSTARHAYLTYDTTAKQWLTLNQRGQGESATYEASYYLNSNYEKYVVQMTFEPYKVFYEDLLGKGTYDATNKKYTYEPNSNYKYGNNIIKVASMYMNMEDGYPTTFGLVGTIQDFGSEHKQNIIVNQEIKNRGTTTITLPQYQPVDHDHTYSSVEYEYVDKDGCRPYCHDCNKYLGEKTAHHVHGEEEVCAKCKAVVNPTEYHWTALEEAFENEYSGLVKAPSNKIYDVERALTPQTRDMIYSSPKYDTEVTSRYLQLFYYPTQKVALLNHYDLDRGQADHSCVKFNGVEMTLITNLEIDLSGKSQSEQMTLLATLRDGGADAILAAYPNAVNKGTVDINSFTTQHVASGSNIVVTKISDCVSKSTKTCDECGLKFECSTLNNHDNYYHETTKPASMELPTEYDPNHVIYVEQSCRRCDVDYQTVYVLRENSTRGDVGVNHAKETESIPALVYNERVDEFEGYEYIYGLDHIYKDGVCVLCGGKLLTDSEHAAYKLVFNYERYNNYYFRTCVGLLVDGIYDDPSPASTMTETGARFDFDIQSEAYTLTVTDGPTELTFELTQNSEPTPIATFTYTI